MQLNLSQPGSSKKKNLAVALLGLLLIVVVSSSFSSNSMEPLAPSDAQLQPVAVANNNSLVNPNGSSDSDSVRPLPQIDLARIVLQNPFLDTVEPNRSSQPGTENQKDVKSETQVSNSNSGAEPLQPTVEAVVTGGRKAAALINDTLYFEKDVVDQRWVIEEILPQTVIFKPIEAASSK